MTRYCAVIGSPIQHSLSPEIHEAFAEQLGIDLVYDRIESSDESFGHTVNKFFSQGGTGLNVTIPFKELAFSLANQLTGRAKLCGSVNTLFKDEQGLLCGDTTDGQGLISDLIQRHIAFHDRPVLILGAGGAARSVIPEFLKRNSQLSILNRTPAKAQKLVDIFETAMSNHTELTGNISVIDPQAFCEAQSALENEDGPSCPFHLIINTMPEQGEKYLEMLSLTDLNDCHVVDISYGTRAEKFLNWCRRRNAQSINDGWGMLVEQAALSFEIWHQKNPDTLPVKKQRLKHKK